MAKFILALACCFLTLLCCAQELKSRNAIAGTDQILSFEPAASGGWPARWGGGPHGTVFSDDKVVHSGHWSARFERDSKSRNEFSTITKWLPIEFSGKTVELRGFLRTEKVSNFVGLWLREDNDQGTLAFDNMWHRHIHGTTDWKQYSIVLPLHEEAKKLYFGVAVPARYGLMIWNCWLTGSQLLRPHSSCLSIIASTPDVFRQSQANATESYETLARNVFV